VIGIVVPTIEEAAAETSGTIAVFATHRTVQTGCYPDEIRKRRPDVRVVQKACPDLAGAIERGASRAELRGLVSRYVQELGSVPECVILGCTHYPLVADLFGEALPRGVRMIHQPEATARALQEYLRRHPEYDGGNSGRRVFLSTGYSSEAMPLIEKFWGGALGFRQA
jgi:glutamate racemase